MKTCHNMASLAVLALRLFQGEGRGRNEHGSAGFLVDGTGSKAWRKSGCQADPALSGANMQEK